MTTETVSWMSMTYSINRQNSQILTWMVLEIMQTPMMIMMMDGYRRTVCGTDPRDGFVSPDDYDSDMICDVVDDDDDNDGIIDVNDVSKNNAMAGYRLNGLGDNEDQDDDGDMWSDYDEADCSADHQPKFYTYRFRFGYGM